MDIPLIVGHRGNTWRVLRKYVSLGVDTIEVDARYSGGEFTAVHGPSPVRRPSLPGRMMAWIDYHFFYRDRVIRPLRLSEILGFLNGRSNVMIDVKQRGVEDRLVSLIDNVGFKGTVYITSELHPVLRVFREIAGRRFKLIASINILAVNMVEIAASAGADMVSIHLSLLDKNLVEDFHRSGYRVLAWTVNDLGQARRLIDMGVDGLVTDDPGLIMRGLGFRVKT